jgi:hypothetical protein
MPLGHPEAANESGWFVSSFTNGTGTCISVKFAADQTILIRDSKDQHAPKKVISVRTRDSLARLASIDRKPH